LEKAREAMGRYYDRGRLAAPDYKVGDLVMLNGKNLRSRRPSRKFDLKMYGPFKIEEIISRMAVRLRLLESWGVHPTFHVKLLEPFRTSARRHAINLDHVMEEMAGMVTSTEFEPEEILGSSFNRVRNMVLYLVRWKDFPAQADWTEEPLDHLEDFLELVEEFHRRNPEAVRDERVIL
jgi:hypothetical protein